MTTATNIVQLGVGIKDRTRSGAISAGRSFEEVKRKARRASQGVDRLSNSVRGAGSAMASIRGIAAGLAGSLAVRGIIRAADSWTLLGNRVRLYTKDIRETSQVQGELFTISQQTRVGLNETAEVYQRLASANDSLGASQSDLLAALRVLNQTVVLSGVSAESASSALIQFGQGLASSELRGQELRSVMEQLPRLAKLISDELGVTRGELLKLGEAGKLRPQVLLQALLNQAKAVNEEFGKTQSTIGQAFTQLGNSLTKYIGQASESEGLTRKFAGGIKLLADNLDLAAKAASALAVGVAVLAAPKILAGVKALVLATSSNPLLAIGAFAAAGITALVQFSDRIKILGDDTTTLADLATAFSENWGDAMSGFLHDWDDLDRVMERVLDRARELGKQRITPTVEAAGSTTRTAYKVSGTTTRAVSLDTQIQRIQALQRSFVGLGEVIDSLIGITQTATVAYADMEKKYATKINAAELAEESIQGITRDWTTFAIEVGSAGLGSILGDIVGALFGARAPTQSYLDKILQVTRATEEHTRALNDQLSTISDLTIEELTPKANISAVFVDSIRGREKLAGAAVDEDRDAMIRRRFPAEELSERQKLAERDRLLQPSLSMLTKTLREGPGSSNAGQVMRVFGFTKSQLNELSSMFAEVLDSPGFRHTDLVKFAEEQIRSLEEFGNIDQRALGGAIRSFRLRERQQELIPKEFKKTTQQLLNEAFSEIGTIDLQSGTRTGFASLLTEEIVQLEEFITDARISEMQKSSKKLAGAAEDAERDAIRRRFMAEELSERHKFAERDRLAGNDVFLKRQALLQLEQSLSSISAGQRLAVSRMSSGGAVTPTGGPSPTVTGTPIAGPAASAVNVGDASQIADPLRTSPDAFLLFPTQQEFDAYYNAELLTKIGSGMTDALDQHLHNIEAHKLMLGPEVFMDLAEESRFSEFHMGVDGLLGRIGSGLGSALRQHVLNLEGHRLELRPSHFISFAAEQAFREHHMGRAGLLSLLGAGMPEALAQHRVNVKAHQLLLRPAQLLEFAPITAFRDHHMGPEGLLGRIGSGMPEALAQHRVNVKAHQLLLRPAQFLEFAPITDFGDHHMGPEGLLGRIGSGMPEALAQHRVNVKAHQLLLRPAQFLEFAPITDFGDHHMGPEGLLGRIGSGMPEALAQHRVNVKAHQLLLRPAQFLEFAPITAFRDHHMGPEGLLGRIGSGMPEALAQHRVNVKAHQLLLRPAQFLEFAPITAFRDHHMGPEGLLGRIGSGMPEALAQHRVNVKAHQLLLRPAQFLEFAPITDFGDHHMGPEGLLGRIGSGMPEALAQHRVNVLAHRVSFSPGDFMSVPTQLDFSSFFDSTLTEQVGGAIESIMNDIRVPVKLEKLIDVDASGFSKAIAAAVKEAERDRDLYEPT